MNKQLLSANHFVLYSHSIFLRCLMFLHSGFQNENLSLDCIWLVSSTYLSQGLHSRASLVS